MSMEEEILEKIENADRDNEYLEFKKRFNNENNDVEMIKSCLLLLFTEENFSKDDIRKYIKELENKGITFDKIEKSALLK